MSIQPLLAQKDVAPAAAMTLQGRVLDSAKKPVADAVVTLTGKSDAAALETKSGADGAFAFSGIRAGAYTLVAKKSGLQSPVADVAVILQDHQQIELDLSGAKADSGASPATQAMEFADAPSFTVAGVTDWTAVGGHGSDSTLRTSEDLARETVALQTQHASGAASAFDTAYALAVAAKDAGDYTRARKQVAKLQAHQDTGDLHRLLGDIDEKAGDPLAAVHEYEQAVRLDASEQNYFAWGSELLLHRAVWQAVEVFGKGTKAYPKSGRMVAALGTALFAGARYDEAAQRLCDAADLNPNDAEIYIFLGKAAMAAPKPLECVEGKLARFAQQQPTNSQATYLYAMSILKRQGQPSDPQAMQQVEELLKQAVGADAKCADGYLQLGVLYAGRRDVRQSMEFYKKAIEANPQLGEAHYRLGMAYDRLGESAKAKQEFALHDEIEKRQAAVVEGERREVKQFLVVLQNHPGNSVTQ